MVSLEGIRHVWCGLCVGAVVAAWAAPAAAQSSAAFPPIPGLEPGSPPPAQAPAPPPPAVAPPATAPPVAPAPPPPAQEYYYYPPPAAPAPTYVEPAPAPPAYGFLPPLLPYRDDAPIPDGYRLESTANTGLLTAGGVVFGLSYAIAFGVAVSHEFDRANGWLVVPLLGPWVALTRRESPCSIDDVTVREDAEHCVDRALGEAALIAAIAVDGLVQATGAALVLGGVFASKQQLVREDVAQVRVLPGRVGRSGYGLGLFGSF